MLFIGVTSSAHTVIPVWDAATMEDISENMNPMECEYERFRYPVGSLVAVNAHDNSLSIPRVIGYSKWHPVPASVIPRYLRYTNGGSRDGCSGGFWSRQVNAMDLQRNRDMGLEAVSRQIAPLGNVSIDSIQSSVIYYMNHQWNAWLLLLRVGGNLLPNKCRVVMGDDGEFICSDWCQRQSYRSPDTGEGQQRGHKYTLRDWLLGPCTVRIASSGNGPLPGGAVSVHNNLGKEGPRAKISADWRLNLKHLTRKIREPHVLLPVSPEDLAANNEFERQMNGR